MATNGLLSLPGSRPEPVSKDENWYTSNLFSGKAEQLKTVAKYVEEKGFIPKELVFNEVSWFYGYVFH